MTKRNYRMHGGAWIRNYPQINLSKFYGQIKNRVGVKYEPEIDKCMIIDFEHATVLIHGTGTVMINEKTTPHSPEKIENVIEEIDDLIINYLETINAGNEYVGLRVSRILLNDFDNMWRSRGYAGRSEAIRSLIRGFIQGEKG